MLDALDKAGINPIGQKNVDADTYRKALDVAKRALTERQLFGRETRSTLPGASSTNRQGMTKAEALAAIDAIERAGGGAPARSNLPGASSTPKAPAGYYYDRSGRLQKSKYAA